MTTTALRLHDRALGALYGLALGDALGMPTQELPRSRAEQLLGAGPVLLAGPVDNPISAGLPAGSITDDTEQALVLARLLVEGAGRVDPGALATALLDWHDVMATRGSLDLLGPTTLAALTAIRAGADPGVTGRGGSTNGAAMRVAPVGIATPAGGPAGSAARLAAAVADAGRPTHDSRDANASAAAVAAVISLGIDGASFGQAWPVALEVADLAADLATPDDAARHELPDLIRRAIRIAAESHRIGGVPAALDAICAQVGTTLHSHESVPAAFAIAALAPDDAGAAAWYAARLGGDADTIAAIAAAMVGACTGASLLPAAALATVRTVNRLDLAPLVEDLLALRRQLRGDVPQPL